MSESCIRSTSLKVCKIKNHEYPTFDWTFPSILEQEEKKNQAIKEEIKEENPDGKEYKPHNIPSRMGMKVPSEKAGRRTGRMNGAGSGPEETNNTGTKTPTKTSPAKTDPAAPVANGNDKTNSFSKELARLQFFGAGPKMAGIPTDKTTKEKTRGMKLNFEYDPVRLCMHSCILELTLNISMPVPVGKIHVSKLRKR